MRPSGRTSEQLREVTITSRYTKHAEGSVLVEFGDTHVLCTASIVDGVPRFLKGKGQGWLTAEYGMLPRATHERMDREAARGKQSGRTLEIQRLIGRSLRNAVDLSLIGERTIYIDCDVIQADGGTRSAAITGGCVALAQALRHIKRPVTSLPLFKQWVACVSVGIVNDQVVLDLDYAEDSNAQTDMNIVMNEQRAFIEIQGTAEQTPFTGEHLELLLSTAKSGIVELVEKQKAAMA